MNGELIGLWKKIFLSKLMHLYLFECTFQVCLTACRTSKFMSSLLHAFRIQCQVPRRLQVDRKLESSYTHFIQKYLQKYNHILNYMNAHPQKQSVCGNIFSVCVFSYKHQSSPQIMLPSILLIRMISDAERAICFPTWQNWSKKQTQKMEKCHKLLFPLTLVDTQDNSLLLMH